MQWLPLENRVEKLDDEKLFSIVPIQVAGFDGEIPVLVGDYGAGKAKKRVIMGVARTSVGSGPFEQCPAYHGFSDPRLAESIKRAMVWEQKAMNLFRHAKGKNTSFIGHYVNSFHFPPRSIHSELFKANHITRTIYRNPQRIHGLTPDITEYEVKRLEIPGIQGNVPVVLGCFNRNGKKRRIPIGVRAVGHRARNGTYCPHHHRIKNVKLLARINALLQ